MKNSSIRGFVVAALAGAVALVGTVPASAVVQPGGQLVRDVAASKTPHVLNGMVYSVTEADGQIVLGGNFARARNDGSATELTRNNLLAFDPDSGDISTSFVPQPNGVVRVVLPAADGKSVYVGGKFTSIGGETRKNLAQIRLSDGAVLPFDAGKISGQVRDLRLAGGRLWIAGHFTHVGGHEQGSLATVDARSGAFLPFMGMSIAGIHNNGSTNVSKIDVNSAGDRLVAVGNFDTLNGVVRHQIFQLDIGGTEARETTFNTRFYTTACSWAFDSYMRDVDYSPDGSFFVVTTTGGYGGAEGPCDASARFETYAEGPTVQPSWINQTGGDTLYAVEVTDSVVYIGGHFRWQNNSFGKDQASYGAVERQGLAALDPTNGLPYSWNPGRARGIGVFDFLLNEDGLWVASDTDRIGPSQYRGRIARLPVDGTTFATVRSAELPNDIYSVGTSTLAARSYRGTIGSARSVSGLNASTVKGAFMINGYLYVAQSDGSFTRRTFDGTTFGAIEAVNTGDLLRSNTTWRDDVRYATGMFYDNGRIYFTRLGSSELRYRYFTPESGVVGAGRMTASVSVPGVTFSSVRGMFLADGQLYWSDLSGVLRRIDWINKGTSGAPVGGTATVVSGPTQAQGGINWSSRDMFLFQDAAGRGAAMPPEAAFEKNCTSLTCTFDGSSSKTPGGDVASYDWTFGDGSTGTGRAPKHTYAASGTYPVTLTITSTRGGTSTTSRNVAVTRVNQLPTAAFTASCHGTVCAFDGTGSRDAEGAVTYDWTFGDGTTGTGASPTHVYVDEGTRQVTLRVTDSDGASHQVSQDVSTRIAKVEFAAAAAANHNSASQWVGVPSSVQGDDLLVLQVSLNSDVSMADPQGWTRLSAVSGGGVAGAAWWRRATSDDANSTVRVELGAVAKGDISLVSYRATGSQQAYVADQQGRVHTDKGSEFASPVVTAPEGGGWLSTYWSLKTSEQASWSEIGEQTARAGSAGVGGGRMVATVSDSAGSVAAGQTGGLLGRSTVEVPRAVVFSTVIGLR